MNDCNNDSHDHNPAGSNLAATLMLDSVARSRSRHLSRAALANGPMMFEIDRPVIARDAAGRAGPTAAVPAAPASGKSTGDWSRHLAAGAARLRAARQS